jgi:hypothetical protein
MKTIKHLVVAIGLSLMAAGAEAHHSFDAEYDSKKPITITGYVTKLDWLNPHAFVYLDVRDDSGAVKNYKVEMAVGCQYGGRGEGREEGGQGGAEKVGGRRPPRCPGRASLEGTLGKRQRRPGCQWDAQELSPGPAQRSR